MGIGRNARKRKSDRNKRLLRYIKAHPEVTLAEVGKIFDISKQRVWELIHQKGTSADKGGK